MKNFILTTTLIATLLPTAALATTGMPGRGGDGHCPIKGLATDPDCAREGAQWRGTGRGTGRVDDDGSGEQAKSRRDQFPRCMNGTCTNRRSTAVVASAESDKRNQFPDDRPRQPGHLG
jgi:hypothetical protein